MVIRSLFRALLGLLALLIALLWNFPVNAQDNQEPNTMQPAALEADAQNVRMLAAMGGNIGSIYFVGTRGYIGEGYRLTILDWSEPQQPVVLGRSSLLPDYVYDIVVVDEYAYVANGYGGLRIFNITNPANPTEVGRLESYGAYQVTVAGHLAVVYVETNKSYLSEWQFVNIQNPAAPVLVGRYALTEGQYAYGMGRAVISGSMVLLRELYRLNILDISNPGSPIQLGAYDAPTGAWVDFDVVGTRIFALGDQAGLHIVDFSNPTNPVQIGASTPISVTKDGWGVLQVTGSVVYVAGSGGIQLLEVAEAEQLTFVDSFTVPAIVRKFFVVGTTLYVADSRNQVSAIGTAAERAVGTQVAMIGRYAAPSSPRSIHVSPFTFAGGAYAYLAEGFRGLHVMRLDSMSTPVSVGSLATRGDAEAVTTDFSNAYIAAGSSGLVIVDVRNPGTLRELGFYDTPGYAQDVALVGGFAYVADYAGGLRIVNVQNPVAPVEVGFFDPYTSGGATSLKVASRASSTYAYLTDGNLRIVNVTNRAAPQQVGSFTTPATTIAVDVVGDHAYLLDSDRTLRVLNISNPAAPVQLSAYQLPGADTSFGKIRVVDNLAYLIAGGGQILRVVNIANPAAPTEVGYFDFKTALRNLFVVERTIFVAGAESGLFVMHYPDCYQLTMATVGRGLTPQLTPDNSPGCPSGKYTPQAFVTLSAGPAPGWRVDRWLGTDSDASTLLTNKLTMPAADFEATVYYATTCYRLNLAVEGEGGLPTVTPSHSITCPLNQYVPGDTIRVHGAPATGWQMGAWRGVSDPANLSTDSTLIMPTGDHIVTAVYTQAPPTLTGDAYEDDNTCAQAQIVHPDGVSQRRSIDRPGDEDWVKFAATVGVRYRIEITIPSNSPADMILELFSICSGAVVDQFDQSFAPGVRLDVTATATGPLFLRLTDIDASAGGSERLYELSVRSLTDVQATQSNRAAIIVGGSYSNPDRLQRNINFVTDSVYRYLRASGYGGTDIVYLSNDAAVSNRTGTSTLGALQAAITVWAKGRLTIGGELVLYLMDHGDPDRFYLDHARGQVLTPAMLDGWLDQLEEAIPQIKITIIIEACYSGSFIEGEQSISKDKPGRLVITSTNAQLLAYASAAGAYFSDFMLSALQQGYSLHNGFRVAYVSVQELSTFQQQPWIDGNGNGIPNEPADITLATQRAIGNIENSWAPYIVGVTGPAEIENRRGILHAVVRDDQEVRRVWAVITPPSYRRPQQSAELVSETLPTILLTLQGNEEYAAEYAGFDESGFYTVAFFAEDTGGLVSQPKLLLVSNGGRVFLPLVTR